MATRELISTGNELAAIAAVDSAEKICLENAEEAVLTFVDLPYPVAENDN